MGKSNSLSLITYGTVCITRHVVKATDKGVTRMSSLVVHVNLQCFWLMLNTGECGLDRKKQKTYIDILFLLKRTVS